LTVYRFAFGLGVASAVAIPIAHLALTDIHHGEADVSLEWNVLRGAFAIMIAFHASGLMALRRAIRRSGAAS
jgi:hypothetical protein